MEFSVPLGRRLAQAHAVTIRAREEPIVIAGGGLAGAAAACLLAEVGRRVILFERDAGPSDKICGEFVSAEAQFYLERIGIDVMALGAHPIHRLRLVHRDREVECALPFAAVGLSRRVLDEALLGHAVRCGAEIRRGQGVALKQDRGPIRLELADGQRLSAGTMFLATGKHDLRGIRRQVEKPSDLVGFKLHLRLAQAQQAELAGHIEITLLEDGYAGLQLVEDGIANLCLLVERSRLRLAGSDWEGLLAHLRRAEPHLAARLAGAEALMRPISISRVPYGFVHAPAADDPPGVFRLGDQVAVIPSFTGDGMSIALHSAAVASACHLAGISAAAYHRRIRRDVGGQITRAGLLYRAGTSATGRAGLMRAAAMWPGGLQLAARLTRVPPAVLRDAAINLRHGAA